MKITTLIENTKNNDNLDCEHGLSLYIKTDKHNVLFDVGATDLFIKNSHKLGVDLTKVDTVIISHGHYDHGGGLAAFLQLNKTAKVYVNIHGFGDYYSKNNEDVFHYIGLDRRLKDNPQIILVSKSLKIDDELYIHNYRSLLNPKSKTGQNLYKKDANSFTSDDFIHEQYLIITENDKNTLLSGCSHRWILDILKSVQSQLDIIPSSVISGLHISSFKQDKRDEICSLAHKLVKMDTKYYTCHCTGMHPYKVLKDIMKETIDYIHTGDRLEI